MSDPSDLLVEYVVKLAKAKTATTDAEQDLAAARVQKGLEILIQRAQKVLDNPLDDGGYEIVFLEEALQEINEADRRYEVAHFAKVTAQRTEGLLETLVEQLKG